MRVFEGGGMPVCFPSKQASSTPPDTALGQDESTDFVGFRKPNFATTGRLAGMHLCVLGCRLENEMKLVEKDQSRIKTNHLACLMPAQKMTRSPRNVSFFPSGRSTFAFGSCARPDW
jgi:hypothetical protein